MYSYGGIGRSEIAKRRRFAPRFKALLTLAARGLVGDCFEFYNDERPRSALERRTLRNAPQAPCGGAAGHAEVSC